MAWVRVNVPYITITPSFLRFATHLTEYNVVQGFRIVRLEDVVHHADIVVTCTGNKNVVTRDHMNK